MTAWYLWCARCCNIHYTSCASIMCKKEQLAGCMHTMQAMQQMNTCTHHACILVIRLGLLAIARYHHIYVGLLAIMYCVKCVLGELVLGSVVSFLL